MIADVINPQETFYSSARCDWYFSGEWCENRTVTKETVGQWLSVVDKLVDIWSVEEFYNSSPRFREGFFRFLNGVDSDSLYLEIRDVFYFQALSALLVLKKGQERESFCSRLRFFYPDDNTELLPKDDAHKIIEGLYSYINERMCMRDVMPDRFEEDIITNRFEYLAKNAYKKILLDDKLFKIFTNDQKIQEFWERRDNINV
jgi:hypothetical protein